MNIDFKILNKNSNFKKIFYEIKLKSQKLSRPVALLVRKNIFLKSKKTKKNNNNNFSREEALKIVIDKLPKKFPLISTTGMLSRELNEINLKKKSEKKTFMCIGGMGHAVSIATGVALKKKIKSSMFGWGWVNNNAFRITCHKCKSKEYVSYCI